MKLSMGTTDVVQVFIKTMGDEILDVSAMVHTEIDGVIHEDEYSTQWEICDISHCYGQDDDGTCLTENGVPCSEEHSFGENMI